MVTKNKFEKEYESVFETINLYPNQVEEAWEAVEKIEIPDSYKDILNIVFCGMGGSALGARIVKALFPDRIRVPFEIYNGYNLPKYAYQKTLVVTSSYSGGTEETIKNFYEAQKKDTKIFGITTGGELAKLLNENNLPTYVIDPKSNPSGQPRMSIGYAVGAIFALLKRLEILELEKEEILEAIKVMKEKSVEFSSKDSIANLALRFANELQGKIPVLISSEHLFGSVYTVKNQFNENAKTFGLIFEIPELNHHLMEGLQNPAKQKTLLEFLFFHSDLYSDRVKLRYPITQKVIEKNGYEFLSYHPTSETKISQCFEVLMFGSFMVYYICRNYEVNPNPIPWVDYFKEELSKSGS